MATERDHNRELPRTRYEPHAKDPRPQPIEESQLELNEDDEEFQTLIGDEPLESEPLPDDNQEYDIERAAGEDDVGGPPRSERNEVYSHEVGRNYIVSATETDPNHRLQDEEDARYAPTDRELSIRHDPRLSATRDTKEGPGRGREDRR